MNIKSKYNFGQKVSSFFLIVLLVWLTVSFPVISLGNYEKTMENLCSQDKFPLSNEEKCENPLSGTAEEKAQGSNSLAEEYLHNSVACEIIFPESILEFATLHSSIYQAFHGDLVVPPPDQLILY